MERKILCYKPSNAENYNKRRNSVKIVILNEVVINRRNNEISTPSSVKTGTQAYRCRKTLNSCRKLQDNMRGPFGDVSLTDCGLLKVFVVAGQMKNLAAAKSS
jgi:hypothetical protein